MKVNGKDYPIYYGKLTCSKPPTNINIEHRMKMNEIWGSLGQQNLTHTICSLK
jgi:hypothetical protein